MELNKPYLVKRVAENSGVLHFLPQQGFCYGVEVNKPQLAKRVALKEGVLHYLLSDQKLDDTTGKLVLNKPYLAKRVKLNADGSLHYLVAGKQCEKVNVTVCGIEYCCQLNASVRIKLTADPTWTEWVNITLNCGGQRIYNSGHACCEFENEDNCLFLKITETITGKDTLASPEPYDTGLSSGTRSCKSVIWDSGNFIVDGKTYRLNYYVVETHIFQTSPTIDTTHDCIEGFALYELVTSGSQYDIYGEYWNLIAGNDIMNAIPAWSVNASNDNPYSPEDCPEDFVYSSGDLIPEGCSFYPAVCAEIDIVDPCNDEDLV